MAKLPVDDVRQRIRQRVGERLRCAREALGWTQRQIAESLGLTPLSVLNYEAGRTPFPTDLLPALDEIGIDSSWVASGIPSLESREARENFAAIWTWVRREVTDHKLSITLAQELDIAWHVLGRLARPIAPNIAVSEQEIIAAVSELLADVQENSR